MGSVERRQRARDEVRRRLLAAAWSLFCELDADQVTMRRIADVTEYSPRTLYLYFADKEALVAAVVEEAYRRTREVLGPSFLPGREALRSLVVRHVTDGLAHPRLYETIFFHLWRPQCPRGEHRQAVEGALTAGLVEAGAAPDLAALAPGLLRTFTLGLIREGQSSTIDGLEDRMERFAGFLLRGLGFVEP